MASIKVEYDGNFTIKEVTDDNGDTFVLEGLCSMCGACCINPNYNAGFNDENGRCSKLITETVDGKLIHKCSIYSTRPVGCLLWPTNQEEIDENIGCTLKYNKK